MRCKSITQTGLSWWWQNTDSCKSTWIDAKQLKFSNEYSINRKFRAAASVRHFSHLCFYFSGSAPVLFIPLRPKLCHSCQQAGICSKLAAQFVSRRWSDNYDCLLSHSNWLKLNSRKRSRNFFVQYSIPFYPISIPTILFVFVQGSLDTLC